MIKGKVEAWLPSFIFVLGPGMAGMPGMSGMSGMSGMLGMLGMLGMVERAAQAQRPAADRQSTASDGLGGLLRQRRGHAPVEPPGMSIK
jgi:predicted lipid-binding transport protein (Tim44 family)